MGHFYGPDSEVERAKSYGPETCRDTWWCSLVECPGGIRKEPLVTSFQPLPFLALSGFYLRKGQSPGRLL